MSQALCVLALLATIAVHPVGAQHMDHDMSMGGGPHPMNMMKPYFHFTPGDAIWFEEWVPRSNGAIFGACLGIFLLAVIERFLTGVKAVMTSWWQKKTEAMVARRMEDLPSIPADRLERPPTASSNDTEKASNQASAVAAAALRRSLPPFVLAYDLVRGVLQAVHMAIVYGLMLIVMTYNVSFIFAILLGVFTGEVMFGRFGLHANLHVHP